jgi:CheY-like chemotaxis protein
MKILYIEDQNPDTIVLQLKQNGTVVEILEPKTLEQVITSIKSINPDLILLDFRLTNDSSAIFDAPTIAQTIRTKKTDAHIDIPVVLISQEDRIVDFYNDYSSQDLFDFSFSKEYLRNNAPQVIKKCKSIISAYKSVLNQNYEVGKILNTNGQKYDPRIDKKLTDHIRKDDIFAFTTFIYNQLIRSIGVLIGEDVLSARLGVSIESNDWGELKDILEVYKY